MNPSSAEPNGSGLRVGTAPVNWNNNDLPNWRPIVPFPRILDEMVDAGYTLTEWDESFGTDVDMLNREREVRGVTFTGAYRWLDFAHDDQFQIDLLEIEPFLETLHGIGAGHLVVADCLRPSRVALAGSIPDDGSESLDPSGYLTIARNLLTLADRCHRFGLKVHYHNHVGSYIETPVEVESLLSVLDTTGVDLCFDTGHYAFGGGDSLAFLTAHLADIGYLHLKDVDESVLQQARAHRWSFLDALRNYIFCPLGEGNAQIREVVSQLVEHAFTGCVILEQDTCRGDSTENARNNLETISSMTTEFIATGSK